MHRCAALFPDLDEAPARGTLQRCLAWAHPHATRSSGTSGTRSCLGQRKAPSQAVGRRLSFTSSYGETPPAQANSTGACMADRFDRVGQTGASPLAEARSRAATQTRAIGGSATARLTRRVHLGAASTTMSARSRTPQAMSSTAALGTLAVHTNPEA